MDPTRAAHLIPRGFAGDEAEQVQDISQSDPQGHRIKIGELGRMANPAFGENLSFCGTSSHLFTMFAVALVITNKYNLHVQ